jgi:hypothetical protein
MRLTQLLASVVCPPAFVITVVLEFIKEMLWQTLYIVWE